MKAIFRSFGIALAVGGFGVMVYGAVLSATVGPDGEIPYGIPGFVLVYAGLGIGAAGLWLAGADFT